MKARGIFQHRFISAALLSVAAMIAMPPPAHGQQEIKSYLATIAGKKRILRQSPFALAERASGDLRTALSLDLSSLDEKEIAAISERQGYFVMPIEYTFLPFNEKAYDKKTDTLVLQLSGNIVPRVMELRVRGIWKMKTGAVQSLESLLDKIFFPESSDEFARKLQIDELDKELISRLFTPYPRLAQLPAARRQLLLDRLKHLPGAGSIRFEQLGDDVYFVTRLGRFPPVPPDGDASPDSETDSSGGSALGRLDLALARFMPSIKQVGEALGVTTGISGICFAAEIYSRDYRKDNYIGGTQLQKSPRKVEAVQYFIPSSVLVSFGRDEITPDSLGARITVKLNDTVVRRPS